MAFVRASQVRGYVKAEVSLAVRGSVDAETLAARLSACAKCPHLQRDAKVAVGYCGACGCGKNPRSELSVKATMPAARCPKHRWSTIARPTKREGWIAKIVGALRRFKNDSTI